MTYNYLQLKKTFVGIFGKTHLYGASRDGRERHDHFEYV
jgi:hypothetical protein